jgi:hypothetical protein
MRYILILALLLPFGVEVMSQTTRDTGVTVPAPVYQAEPQKKGFFARLFGGNRNNNAQLPEEVRKDFEKRMKALNRQKAKEARQSRRPQHSNTFYFGHKRKPKKRPPGKKKYCRICRFEH